MKDAKRCFTLVELLVTISIIGILAGMVFPTFTQSMMRAKHVRWFAFNAGYDRDTDTVVNFNFEEPPTHEINDGVKTEVLNNPAAACDAERFTSDDYRGILRNSPEWIKGGGRWPMKNAMQFDGSDDYIEIKRDFNLNFDPLQDEFSIIVWANFYSLSTHVLCSKGEDMNEFQYGAYTSKSRVAACVGESDQDWASPVMKTLRWYQIALVNEPGKEYKLYVDGKMAEDPHWKKYKEIKAIKKTGLNLVIGALLERSSNPGNGKGVEKGKGKGLLKKKVDSVDPVNCFRGRIDEFVILKRALNPNEIQYNYTMGNPY
jgi:prepilin-type N-terminal cleavage/methylation domain-containing protein